MRMDNYEIWPDDEYGEYFDYYVPTAAQYQRGLIYGVPTIIGMQSEYGKWAL